MYKVSVICFTYNHEKYIQQCMDSILTQKCDFKYQIIVHDDNSNDKTLDILKSYKKKNTNLTIIQNKEKKIIRRENFNGILKKLNIKGEFIALCDGDDYWTSPYKLKEQVDFLEKNIEFSFCCHRFKMLKNKKLENEFAHNKYIANTHLQIDYKTYFSTWATQPSTCMYRASYNKEITKFSENFNYFRDVHIFYFLLSKGKGVSLNKSMSIYRIHDQGIASGKSIIEKLKLRKKIFQELIDYNPKDTLLKKQYLNVARRLILRSKEKNKISIYLEALPISFISFREFLKLHYYLLKK